MIIEPPAYVFVPAIAAIAPPGVGSVGGGGLQLAVHIYFSCFAQQARHPGALFRQKPGKLQAFCLQRMVDIDRLMADINIAANDQPGTISWR